MMKKLFSLFVALFVTTALWAHDFEVNGIYYNYRTGNDVEVTYKGSDCTSYYDEYSGDIIIPSSVTYRGTTYNVTGVASQAFSSCGSLTSVTMPNSVVKLGGGVFYDCYNLKSVTLSANITSLPTYVVTYDDDPDELFGFFANCYSLESIVIPEGVTTIGDKAFESCTSLKEIILPNTVTNLGKAAFYSCSKLRSVTLSENITSLQSAYYVAYWDEVYYVYGCFSACSSLESIRLPEAITRLEKETFYGCNSLKSVHVESTNPSQLEDDVFSSSPICYVPCGAREKYEQSIWAQYVNRFVEEGDCPVDPAWQITYTSSDGNIVTPNNADVFGANMVSNVYKNGTGVITLDGPVTSIGNDAFYGCSSLTSVTIPNSVTSIGMNAFYNCSSLYSINIPNNLTSIGDGAFVGTEIYNNRTNWKNDVLYISDCLIEADPFYISGIYTIKQGTRLIADDAFAGCRYLTSVIIPNGVTTIGGGAFQTCYALTSITIPNSVMSIGEFAFHACNSLTSITIPNGVTCIRNYVFQSCNSLTSITIPNSVASIGDYAFRLCSLLDTIHVEAPVPPTLGYSVFDNTPASFCYIPCGTKSAYEASDWAQYMGEFVEEGCVDSTRIITYTSSDGNIVTPYKSNAFGVNIVSNTYENGVGTITFDAPVTSIGDYAFFACSSLTSITIPNSVTSIEYFAFYDCSSLTSVTIPNSVTSIGNSVFNGCSKLTSITIPNSVTSIEYRAFSDCSSLTSITIPNSVTSIGNLAFSGCSSLTSVVWNAKNCADFSSPYYSPFGSQITSFTFGDSVEHIPASLCYGMKNLKSITIPNSVTSIGEKAFFNCNSSLISINVDKSNSKYDSRDNCNAIIETATNTLIIGCKNTIIPNGVTSIENYAFYSCSSLTSITIPNSVTSIGYSSFSDCSSLTSITIPNSVTSIGGSAFSNCSSLTSLTIPNSLTSIGDYAFYRCSSLTSVTIPNSVTSIGEEAFNGCYRLTSVTIGNSVTSIGYSAFAGCRPDTMIIKAPTPPSLYTDAFTASIPICVIPCGTLAAYQASDWAQYVGEFVEEGCVDSTRIITYTSTDGNIVVPYYEYAFGANIVSNTYENGVGTITFDAPITRIGYGAFSYCSSLTSITIPNSVTWIGEKAFSDCSSLTSVTIPNGITSIDDYAFRSCKTLTSITIPNSVTSIGNDAFAYCSSLTSITIPESVMSIGDQAFYYCEALTSITIPNSVTSIGSDTFRSCSSLTSVTIGNSVTSIGDQAFAYCFSLTSINIPNSVTSIGNDAFSDCSSLTSVTIPNSVTSIGARAFSGCTFIKDNFVNNSSLDAVTNNYWGAKIADIELDGLLIRNDTVIDCRQSVTMVVIPDYITCIGNYAFSDCSSLTSVTIPNSVTSIGIRAFSRCSSLTSVSIPNSVISIGEVAFDGTAIYHDEANWESGVLYISNCLIEAKEDILSYYAIKENTRILANSAFRFCSSLTSITIPESVTGIGENAFQYCTSLKSITCEAIEPPTVGDYTFGSVPTSIPVYVPCGRVETYKATPLWNNFSNIQEPLAEYSIIVDVNDNAMGIVEVNNSACGCQISAIPNAGYRFVEWSDGNIDNPRSLELTQNTSLVANFEIIILTPDTATICYGDTYQWNDRTYDASGTYYDTLSTGLATLHLTVLPAVEETVQDVSICEGSTYTWKADGKVYSESGNYSITVQDVNGCDSVVTLHLTVNSLVTTEETIIACDSYEWNDETYTESGDYTYTTTAANGCDSIVTLHLTINQTQYVEETVTACDSYEWNGETYTESGDYTYTTTAANGCDSIITLHLTFNKTQYVEETVTACDSYTWNGEIYNESGEYVYTTTAANGCDSIVTLHLTINKTQYAEVTATACDSYVWNGETYTTSGEYTYTTTAANGCDSIVTLHLTINKSSVSSEEHATICYGETYIWNGQAYATSGDYSVILSNVAGCDSVATLHLTVMPEAVTTTETIIIGSDALPYIWRDKEYSSTGRYSDIEQYTSVACDSAIHYLDLTVLTTGNLDEQSATICETELPYIWYDQSLTESGKYTYTEQYVGTTIDSVQHILNLIIIPTTYTTEDVIINIGESYTWHGATYDETGEYSVTLSNVAGCDSIVTLHLTVVSTIYYTSTDGNVVTPYNPNAFDVNIISNTYENGQGIIILDGPVTMIGSDAFYNCSTLASIDIPNGVVSIKKGAFQGCSALTSIAIPDGVTCVERQSFYKCEALKTIHLSNTLESIGSYAFCHCISLEAIDIPEGVTMIDECTFYNCPSLASISMGDAITRIGKSAFFNCTSLTSVDIPNSVTCIAGSAFSSCVGLTAITIPHAVTSIGNKAFYNCHSFSSITNEAIVPPVIEGGDSTFLNVSKSIPVYVPCSTVDAYKAAYLWSNFTNIQEPLPTYSINVDVNDNAMGIVEVNNSACGCQISAIPNAGYRFVEWSDGNIDNPRSLELTQNTSLVANFEIIILTPDTATICYGDTYQWNDRTYDVTGTYYDTLSTGLATLHLTVLPAVEETIHNVSICQGNTYTWQVDGQVYSESGIYSITLQDVNGCDSVVTLNLIVNPIATMEEAITACDSYDWNGQTYTSSGDYTYTTTAKNGCDSIVTLHLTIYNSEIGETEHATICYGETYTWNGRTYSAEGEYSVTLSNTLGCDSIATLHLTIMPEAVTTTETVIIGSDELPYTWRGKEYSSTGRYSDIVQYTSVACDSAIHVLDLTVLTTGNLDEQSVTICETEAPYTWYGESYSSTGKYTYTEQYVGTDIDSVQHILNLTVNPTVYVEETITACDTYTWNGETYTTSGEYTYTTTAKNGCDSIVTLHLTINKTQYAEVTATACDSYAWNGETYTASGEYVYTTTAKNGCDSIVTLHLTINQTQYAEESVTACDSYAWNGETYTASGEYVYTTTAKNGCDSIVTLHLTINQTQYAEESVTACDSYAWNGETYTASGDYVYTTTATNGCDSIVTLHLTINPTQYAEETVVACDSYTWNGQTYTESGEYTYTTTAKNGCDSIVTLHLTINETQYTEESITACDSYAWNGETYTASGDYVYTTTAANGCDSIVTLHLTINQTQYAEESVTACDSYAWNGETYTESGEYVYSTVAANGCDSIVTLHLTINQSEVGTTEYVTICYGETYTWNGQTYSATGEYSVILSNALGCDSVTTLSLTMMPEAITTTETVVIGSDELPYTWRGNTYATTGRYTDVEQYAAVACDSAIHVLDLTILVADNYDEQSVTICDSETPYLWYGEAYSATGKYTYTEQYAGTDIDSVQHILNLTVNLTKYTEESVVACDSYAWNSETYTASGDYTYTTTAKNGCDSIVTLHLTINKTQYAEVEATACDSYAWNGETYTTSGEYTYTTTAKNGCDSIVTLHLTINKTQYAEVEATACDSYAWNGETYTTSGEYTYTTTAKNGCDSIVTLHLTINKTQYAEVEATACDSYDWNGKTYTESGEYTYTTTAKNGCDSIVTLHLTINKSEVGTTEYASICYGETYTWHGQTYSATDEYSVTLSNVNGCDSVATLRLTVMPKAVSDTLIAIVGSDELPYLWRGKEYASTGIYTIVEQYATVACDSAIHVLDLTVLSAGALDEQSATICETELPYIWYNQELTQSGKYTYTEQYVGTDIDSIQHVLTLTVNPTVYVEETVTACNSYTWNGETYTESGEYTYTTTAANGCDSIVTLHLTINATKYAEETVVACDSYDWNGETYTQSGEYTYTTTATNGCDSIVTLHLTINNTQYAVESVVACDSYTWNGETYTTSGEYTYTTTAKNGCDSIVTLHLTINATKYTEETVTACDSYTWNGETYTASGEYTYTTTAKNGCDSIVTLHLTINATKYAEEHVTACDAYTWNGQTYATTGAYTYTTTASNGCDSIITLHLTINRTQYAEETVTACDNYTWNGETYTESGEYTFTTTATNGCDSIVTLHLTINNTQYAEVEATACDSYDWNGETYTESGEYTFTTTATNGCDSIVTLHLTINQTQYAEVEATACDSYDWNGEVYTQSGEYVYTTTATNGCDSIVTLHLTINKSEREEYTEVACDEYVWNGVTYTESGDYTYNTTTAAGCERIEVLHLTINKSEYEEYTATACDEYVWNGVTYTESGDYKYYTTTAAGCERIEVLHLTINRSEREEYTATACDEYVWNGVTYTESGDYTYNTTTAVGCERIEVLHLTILPDATAESETLALCPSELPYEWYGQSLTEAGTYSATEPYAGMECDSVVHELTLNIYTQTLPSSVTLPIVRMGEAIDVSVPTAEIQAHIAADTWYAPGALIAWYILDNSNWATLTDEPVSSGINEVVMKYAVDSDCGSVESDRIIIPVETTGVENIPTDEMGVYKVVRDNQIFIIRGGKIYSIVGHTIENGMSIGL